MPASLPSESDKVVHFGIFLLFALLHQVDRRSSIWLTLLLSLMFSSSFKAGQAHFANDGPLGAQASRIYNMPGAFFGIWSDLYWVGSHGGNYTANFTGLLLWLLGPIGFNKFVVPSAQLPPPA